MISGSNLNISTANFKSNLTPADKTAKTNLANEQMQASKNKEDVKKTNSDIPKQAYQRTCGRSYQGGRERGRLDN